MKNLIAEYGLTLISALLVSVVFSCVYPMFQDDGLIKDAIMDYITHIC